MDRITRQSSKIYAYLLPGQGKFAYVPQRPWIQNATLRNNILFDSPYVHKTYKAVMEACALNSDLKTLPVGDFTEIGQKVTVCKTVKYSRGMSNGIYIHDIYIYIYIYTYI